MKILLLHQHFNTPEKGGPQRSYYLAKSLVDAGHQVHVVTIHNDNKRLDTSYERIQISYLPVSYDNRFGFYKRGIAFVRYVWETINLSAHIQNVDVCYAISTPITVGIAALRLKFKYQIPYIFEVGDLWPRAPIELGIIRSPFLKWLLYGLEKKVYREANAIVALSEAISHEVKQVVGNKPVYVVSNFSDTEFYFPAPKQDHLQKKFNTVNKFVVTYIGALGYANGLDYFLECARAAMRKKLPIQFFICGDGAMLDVLKKSADNLQLNNLVFYPLLDRNGVKEILNVTDANFVCYRPELILETGSPNKYFDGLAAGKLTLINFNGWIREEVERERCGIHLDKNHPAVFADNIMPFLQNHELLSAYQKNARSLALKKYAREILSHQFVKIIEQNLKA